MTELPRLEVRDLHAGFGALQVLRGVSLLCRAGEITTLVGPNGSGKSTLLRCISARLRPLDGTILLDGAVLPREAAWKRARRGIAFTFQEVSMPLTLSLSELISLSAETAGTKDLPAFMQGDLARAAHGFLLQPWHTLSFGQRKLSELLVATIRHPRLLLLDEPMAGLSRQLLPVVASHLKELAAAGTAILVVEHDREFVAQISDRVQLLSRGMVLASGTAEEVFAAPATLEALL